MDHPSSSAHPVYKHVSTENSRRPPAHNKRSGQRQPNNRGESSSTKIPTAKTITRVSLPMLASISVMRPKYTSIDAILRHERQPD